MSLGIGRSDPASHPSRARSAPPRRRAGPGAGPGYEVLCGGGSGLGGSAAVRRRRWPPSCCGSNASTWERSARTRPSSPARRAQSCRASVVVMSDGLNATRPEGEGSGAAGTARGGVGGPPGVGFARAAGRGRRVVGADDGRRGSHSRLTGWRGRSRSRPTRWRGRSRSMPTRRRRPPSIRHEASAALPLPAARGNKGGSTAEFIVGCGGELGVGERRGGDRGRGKKEKM
ncbi:hypothetical protein PVAP13_4NG249511 [Panicum virgatum]|uniref:Uncharacterized protein n=1 Tax=Panicum virgatum TaxID=38727 RepID=A0A8T0THL2_PANVG|nr:hypothetical protein PVAP13_4NG249511 [Panicum virgatum]